MTKTMKMKKKKKRKKRKQQQKKGKKKRRRWWLWRSRTRRKKTKGKKPDWTRKYINTPSTDLKPLIDESPALLHGFLPRRTATRCVGKGIAVHFTLVRNQVGVAVQRRTHRDVTLVDVSSELTFDMNHSSNVICSLPSSALILKRLPCHRPP